MGVRIPPPLPYTQRDEVRGFERRLGRCNHEGGWEGGAEIPSEAHMGFLTRVQEFVREVLIEFRKVMWPSRQELLNSTTVVIVVTIVLAFFLGGVDIGLARIVERILR